jgi:hypothetical protein
MNYINNLYSKFLLSRALQNPSMINLLATIMAKLCPSSDFYKKNIDSQNYTKQLKDRGYTDPLPLLTPKMVKEMRTYFENQYCYDPWRKQLGEFYYKDIPSPETNMGWYTREQVLSCPYMLDVLNNQIVISTIANFLQCKPTLGFTEAWWSYTNRAISKGSQCFHRDFDGIKFIKLIIYLTDVGADDGPTEYVEGTANDKRHFHTKAIDDVDIINTFGKDSIHRIIGPAGYCFLADTRGIHKGSLPVNNDRLAIFSQYTILRSTNSPPKPHLQILKKHHDKYLFRHYMS